MQFGQLNVPYISLHALVISNGNRTEQSNHILWSVGLQIFVIGRVKVDSLPVYYS